jgi:hypothetical protein
MSSRRRGSHPNQGRLARVRVSIDLFKLVFRLIRLGLSVLP